MSRVRSLFLVAIAAAAVACGSETNAPELGDKLTGFTVGQVGDSTTSGAPVGTDDIQVGGTVRGVGVGSDTMATSIKLADVQVKAFKHLGYSGNDVLVGEEIGTLTTNADGWFGYLSLPPGEVVVTFTTPANSQFRSIYVTYYSQGTQPGNTIASLWTIFLPRK
jgi:hypothetical protein